jgi:arabinose-5-phosphate isomerase
LKQGKEADMTLQIHPVDDRLLYARQIVRGEAAALLSVADRLDESFLQTVELFHRCPGRICITGTGKSADVGQKIAGTLNSTGTRAYVLDATRAVHGDLGMLHPDDIVLALSFSGETEEIVKLLPSLRQMAHAVVALTKHEQSTLAKHADIALLLGSVEEVCPLGLAPSTSTTAMIAVGDALAFVLMRMRAFTHEDFARFHPAGSLGRKLVKVEAVMRHGHDVRVSDQNKTVREVFAQEKRLGRRTGAVMLVDDAGQLSGLFTDSDLARLFERHKDDAFDQPIRDVMTPKPLMVAVGTRLTDAVDILRNRKISELPVVDALGKPVGMIDITDLIGLISREEAESYLRAAG